MQIYQICRLYLIWPAEVCGKPFHLQPHELRFLWSKRAGWLWKFQLLAAAEKIPLLEKIAGKIYRKSRIGQKRLGAHGMDRAKLFSKEGFYMNFVNVIRKIIHFWGADRNFVYWQWKTAFTSDDFEVAA